MNDFIDATYIRMLAGFPSSKDFIFSPVYDNGESYLR